MSCVLRLTLKKLRTYNEEALLAFTWVLELERPDFCEQLLALSDTPSHNTAFEVCGQEAPSCEYQVDAETTNC